MLVDCVCEELHVRVFCSRLSTSVWSHGVCAVSTGATADCFARSYWSVHTTQSLSLVSTHDTVSSHWSIHTTQSPPLSSCLVHTANQLPKPRNASLHNDMLKATRSAAPGFCLHFQVGRIPETVFEHCRLPDTPSGRYVTCTMCTTWHEVCQWSMMALQDQSSIGHQVGSAISRVRVMSARQRALPWGWWVKAGMVRK